MKKWGRGEYWGVGSDFDPDWLLTPKQKKLRDDLMEVCRVKIRPHAVHCDREYVFPRESLNAMADLGLLGLIVPKELGGLGENHTCCVMVLETLARYGCPSTAMVYTMHLGAVTNLLMRHHTNPHFKDLLSRLDKDKLVGTQCFSDPGSAGHVWLPMSSKVQQLDDNTLRLIRYCSWVTSAGHADFYTAMTVNHKKNPSEPGSNTSTFLLYKDEVRTHTDDWSGLGLHGNMSGPLVAEGIITMDRMIGESGKSWMLSNEVTVPYFLQDSAAVWNGLSMACIDVARKLVTTKVHADIGMKICDYPTIQDYIGDAVAEVNSSRGFTYWIARAMDDATNNNDWAPYADLKYMRRCDFLHWTWQVKMIAAKVVSEVSDKMLHVTGGSGYKNNVELERLLRDGKAGWVMGPSNEILRQLVGKCVLYKLSSSEVVKEKPHEGIINKEIKKMNKEDKRKLTMRLLEELRLEDEGKEAKHPFQDTDFDNPFNTCTPASIDKIIKTPDGVSHSPALSSNKWTPLKLQEYRDVSNTMGAFVFALPSPTHHTGCLPGQYVAARIVVDGKQHTRYFSPVSATTDFGRLEIVMKFENCGIMSQNFRKLKPGDTVEFQGPCGGFEYEAGVLEELTLLASGGGITPCLQLVRQVLDNPGDKTKITLLYYAENYNEILYREELDKYQAADKRLKLVYTLGECPQNWEGEEGFIDTKMIEKHVTKFNGIKTKIVMCGGPMMTLTCLDSLRSLGFPSHSVFVYGQFGTEQVRTVYGQNIPLASHHC